MRYSERILLGSVQGIVAALHISAAAATTYEVGPNRPFANIGDVPWESLVAGDTVRIHYRPEPYAEKWVICRQGAPDNWIVVQGVPDEHGNLPVIDGRDATTRQELNYWNEERSLIKIGGANSPPNTMPRYILIENLDIRSARPPYSFTGRNGLTYYNKSAASIFVEYGENIVIRNCILRDSGNGLFVAQQTKNILIEGCHIFDNGIKGSIYQHNAYTEAQGITYQFNYFGPLRDGCSGQNLKDRSAGCVIRYNWIESGQRQLDLVESSYYNDWPDYRSTFVYGNILFDDGFGNRQIVHYGGDGGNTGNYRKGTLHFYNNTVISTRSGQSKSTLLRLSTNDETADVRNNIVYITASGENLEILADAGGTVNLRHNWLKSGWVHNHFGTDGTVNDLGGNLSGASPEFIDFAGQNFELARTSVCVNAGTTLHVDASGGHDVTKEYVRHMRSRPRPDNGLLDIGAYEVAPVAIPRLHAFGFNDGSITLSVSNLTRYATNRVQRSFDLRSNGWHDVGSFPTPEAAAEAVWSDMTGGDREKVFYRIIVDY